MGNPAQRFSSAKGATPAAKPATGPARAGRGAPARPAAPRRASRFAGIDPGGDQDPLLEASNTPHRVKVISSGESQVPGRKPYFKIKLEVLESDVHEVGQIVGVLQCTDRASESAALPRISAFAMAGIGCPSKEDFQLFDPEGFFRELVCGEGDSYEAPEGLDWIEAGMAFGPNPLEGVELMVLCSRGKPTKDSQDYFRNCQWWLAEPRAED